MKIRTPILYRMVADSEGSLEITVSPSPDGTGRFAYLNALELMVEPWPLTFSYWRELNGIGASDPMSDTNKNGIPELMDFFFGNEGTATTRNALFEIEDGMLTAEFPIRENVAISGILYLEQSSDLKEPWTELAHYNFTTLELSNLEPFENGEGSWLRSQAIAMQPGFFFRLRAEVP